MADEPSIFQCRACGLTFGSEDAAKNCEAGDALDGRGYVSFPNLPPKPLYPIEAEAPIVAAMEDREGWLNVSPTAIATTALTALREAGWRLIPPASARNGRHISGGES